MGLFRSRVGERSTASCRKSLRTFLKVAVHYHLVFKYISVHLNYYNFFKSKTAVQCVIYKIYIHVIPALLLSSKCLWPQTVYGTTPRTEVRH